MHCFGGSAAFFEDVDPGKDGGKSLCLAWPCLSQAKPRVLGPVSPVEFRDTTFSSYTMLTSPVMTGWYQ